MPGFLPVMDHRYGFNRREDFFYNFFFITFFDRINNVVFLTNDKYYVYLLFCKELIKSWYFTRKEHCKIF